MTTVLMGVMGVIAGSALVSELIASESVTDELYLTPPEHASIEAVTQLERTSIPESAPALESEGGEFITGVAFEALSFPGDSGFIPPDPIIAAGPASLVVMVNTDIAIYDKTGSELLKADLDGAGGFWATNNIVFDPWVVFDPIAERFIAMGLDRVTSGGGSSRIYLAVSTSDSPTNLTSDWNKYIINRTGTHQGTGGTTFPNYPKLGVNDEAIFITGNDFGILSGGFSHVSLFALEKTPLLSGGPANILYDEVITGAFSVHPAVVFDAGSAMFFAEAVGSTGIRVHTLTDVLGTPARVTQTVLVPTFFFPPDVPQLDGPPLDSVSQRIMSGVVRDGSLWTAHAIRDPAVDTETVVRWYELDVSLPPSLVQSGNVDPGPGIHTWMPHINADDLGNMALGFSVSGPAQYAAIGYTGRGFEDPPGTTRPVQIARAGEGPYSRFDGIGRNRWGDYSGLAIDPNDITFWLFNEYPAAGNNWATYVAAFEINNNDVVAQCQDVTVVADASCQANASIDAGSFDPNGDTFSLSQVPPGPYSLGDTLVELTVTDEHGLSDTCEATVTVVDETHPTIACNNPPTIIPPDAPINFTATAEDQCGPVVPEVVAFECFKFTKKGKRVDKTNSCSVSYTGDTVTIVDPAGVGTHVEWTVAATDGSGNTATEVCSLIVANPGRGN